MEELDFYYQRSVKNALYLWIVSRIEDNVTRMCRSS